MVTIDDEHALHHLRVVVLEDLDEVQVHLEPRPPEGATPDAVHVEDDRQPVYPPTQLRETRRACVWRYACARETQRERQTE